MKDERGVEVSLAVDWSMPLPLQVGDNTRIE